MSLAKNKSMFGINDCHKPKVNTKKNMALIIKIKIKILIKP